MRDDGRTYAEVAPKPDSHSPDGASVAWAVLTPQQDDPPLDQDVPAGQALVTFMTYGSCEHPVLARYEFIFEGDSAPVVFPIDPPAQFGGGRCDEPGQQLSLNVWAVTPVATPTPTPAAPTPLPVVVTLEAPSSVRAGDVLTFLVTITNTSPTTLAFDECPAYSVVLANDAPPVMTAMPAFQKPGLPPVLMPSYLPLAGSTKLRVLNCEPAGAISSGASATFAIELTVLPGAPLGASTLTFELAPQPLLFPRTSAEIGIEVVR